MIYDKNQFLFNMIFTSLIIVFLLISVFFSINLLKVKSELEFVNQKLGEIEENQHLINYIQGSHDQVPYQLTPSGFFISGANDFGELKGSSMQPSIFEGNTLIQLKYTNQSLSEGQIVRYIGKDNVPFVHRIRAVYDETLLVQGDNLEISELISKSQVTHLVIGVLFT